MELREQQLPQPDSFKQQGRFRILEDHWKALLVLFSTWGLYFFTLWPRIISFKTDGLYLGHVNVWSDWALHIGMTSIFAFKDPQYWFAYHPMYAYGQFTYPFLTNLISGMLMKAGFSLVSSLIVPSIFFSLLLLVGLYSFFCIVLRSKAQALLAISFFFLSSGFGFINFLGDFLEHPSAESLLYPPREYSRVDSSQWGTGNVIVGMLLPQRAFLLGMTVSIWVLTGVLYVLLKKSHETRRDFMLLVCAGLGAGLLPITHMHSFIVVSIVSGFLSLALWRKWRLLLFYIVPAALLSSLSYFLFVHGGIENPREFFQWYPGWTIKNGLFSWIAAWLYFWGVMIPLAIFGYVVAARKNSWVIRVFFLSFFVLFALSNLVRIQPIPWDNSKIFLWVYLGYSGLAAVALAWFWRRKFLGKLAALFFTVLLTFTGVLELVHLQRTDRNQILGTSTEDISLGLQIREQTHPLAVFLTDSSHNHLVMMWGLRPILMGYTAWVWNYGFQYHQREQDIRTMFQGGPSAEELIKNYKVSYVVIGPGERRNFRPDEEYFASKFPRAFQNQNYQIYDVRMLWFYETNS